MTPNFHNRNVTGRLALHRKDRRGRVETPLRAPANEVKTHAETRCVAGECRVELKIPGGRRENGRRRRSSRAADPSASLAAADNAASIACCIFRRSAGRPLARPAGAPGTSATTASESDRRGPVHDTTGDHAYLAVRLGGGAAPCPTWRDWVRTPAQMAIRAPGHPSRITVMGQRGCRFAAANAYRMRRGGTGPIRTVDISSEINGEQYVR
jgi:hypothetical protein